MEIELDRCCDCGFNEHDQDMDHIGFESYLGYNFYEDTLPGGPIIICLYDPKSDFRDNIRRITHWGYYHYTKLIAKVGEPEFDEQLNGIPDWCPLKV